MHALLQDAMDMQAKFIKADNDDNLTKAKVEKARKEKDQAVADAESAKTESVLFYRDCLCCLVRRLTCPPRI